MATLEQLAEGIKRAHAAGDAAAVQKLGAAYRKMQGQPTAGDQAMAAASAASGKLKGKVADLPSQRPSFGEEAMSFGRGIIEGIPIAGPTLADWRQGLDANIASLFGGGNADELKAGYKAADEELRGKTGGTRLAGNVTGSVAALAPLGMTALGGRLLGTTGTLGQRVVAGGLSGSAISGADTAARGGDLGQIATNAAVGAGLGLALPAAGGLLNKLGNKSAQTRATTAAIANAPDATDLKSTASNLFKQVDQAGVTINPNEFRTFVVDLAKKAKGMRINATLDPKAYATFQELGGIMGEVAAGKPLTMSDLHTIRQIAQKAAISAEGRDAMFANQIVDGIDSFITKPGATVSPNGATTGKQLMEAISTWGRAKRVGLVEAALERAKNTASGFENGVRIEFRKLLNNKKTAGAFTAAEKAEIERVVRGTPGANLAKLVGKFGFGGGNASNMLGGTIGTSIGATLGSGLGPLGTMVGAGIAGGGATAARKLSEKLTEAAAERAAKVVATPGIPVIPPRALPNGIIPPALIPLETTKNRKPIEIEVRGGAR
jgi:hypothetical protein